MRAERISADGQWQWVDGRWVPIPRTSGPAPTSGVRVARAGRAFEWKAIGERDRRPPAVQPAPPEVTGTHRGSVVHRAQEAIRAGIVVFQCSLPVDLQEPVAVTPDPVPRHTTSPDEVLSAVCALGWELVGGSVLLIDGHPVGFYVFRRRT